MEFRKFETIFFGVIWIIIIKNFDLCNKNYNIIYKNIILFSYVIIIKYVHKIYESYFFKVLKKLVCVMKNFNNHKEICSVTHIKCIYTKYETFSFSL